MKNLGSASEVRAAMAERAAAAAKVDALSKEFTQREDIGGWALHWGVSVPEYGGRLGFQLHARPLATTVPGNYETESDALAMPLEMLERYAYVRRALEAWLVDDNAPFPLATP